MLIFWGDKLAWKILRHDKKSVWIRQGQCQKTGMCCQDLAIEMPKSWVKRPWLMAYLKNWYDKIYNFDFIEIANENMMFFRCRHLSPEKTCSIYPFRPKLCREYPSVTLFGHANVHKGCGFSFKKRGDSNSFESALEKAKPLG